MNHIESAILIHAAKVHLGIDDLDEDEVRTSIIDLTDTDLPSSYVTALYTDNGDTEKLAIVVVSHVSPEHPCWTTVLIER